MAAGMLRAAAMYNTTWYNDSGDSVDTITEGSFNGWHTVVIVVSGGHVKYYDGTRLLADHSGKYYPRSKMNIIPQLWFSDNNAAGTWHIDVDWVYYARNAVLTAAQVEAEVDGLRASGVRAGIRFSKAVPSCPRGGGCSGEPRAGVPSRSTPGGKLAFGPGVREVPLSPPPRLEV